MKNEASQKAAESLFMTQSVLTKRLQSIGESGDASSWSGQAGCDLYG